MKKDQRSNLATCVPYFVFLILMACQTMASAESSTSTRPNILLFTADDLHAESLGVYGSKAEMTPNLDKFAASGLVFENAYVNAAICSPSRKIIATGLYGHNSGAMGFKLARPGTPNLINTLSKAGYLTGVIDKVKHSTPSSDTKWDYIRGDNRNETANGRSPALFYKHTKAFLNQCKEQKKPFYLMVNSRDPHRPYCSKRNLGHAKAEPPSRWYEPEDVEVPDFLPDLPQVRKELAEYQNSTRRLDDTFGKVIQALDESGFTKNTLVIFISDNGIAMPFAKANTWFHATRTPMLVRLPGVVTPETRDSNHLVSGIDFFPTFMEFTGVKGPKKLDGRSFLPILSGKKQDGREVVFTQIDTLAGSGPYPMRSVQTRKYGYIYNPFSDGQTWYSNNNEGNTMEAMNAAAKRDPAIKARVDLYRLRTPEEFYDLEKDPDCLKNLINDPKYSSDIEGLKKQLSEQMKKASDPMLEAFKNMDDRAVVDRVIKSTYGKLAKSTRRGRVPGRKKRKKK